MQDFDDLLQVSCPRVVFLLHRSLLQLDNRLQRLGGYHTSLRQCKVVLLQPFQRQSE